MANYMDNNNATEVFGAYANKINKIDPISITWANYQLLSEADKNSHRYIITDYPAQGAGQQLGTAAFKNAGVANGVADLDANGKVPASQLPSYVDDIIEGYLYNGVFYSDSEHEHAITGETGKIYVDLVSDNTYRWGGSAYVEISESLALGETPSTAYAGDKGKANADNITTLQSGKADKVSGATNGNLAGLDANGNLTDAGWASDKTTTSATGNPISISGLKSNQLAINPIITLEPIQAGSGDPSPSNVRAISGYDKIEVVSCGKNIWDEKWEEGTYNTVTGEKTENPNTIRTKNKINVKPNTSYYCGIGTSNGSIWVFFYNNNVLIENYSTGKEKYDNACRIDNSSFTTPSNCSSIQFYVIGEGNTYANDIIIAVGSSATTYEPYNPITDIQLQLGETIYGGTLDVEKGVLTVTKKFIDCKSLDFTLGPTTGGLSYYNVDDCLPRSAYSISNKLQYNDEGWSSTTPCFGNNSGVTYLRIYGSTALFTTGDYADSVVVGTLKTPYTIQLAPHEISLLSGYSYVSTNGTSLQLTYRNGEVASLADVAQLGQTVNKLGDAVSADNSAIDAIVNVYGSKNLLPMTVDNIKKANESYGYTWNGNSTTVHGVTFTILTDSDNIVTGIQANGTATDNIVFLIQDRINAFDLANGTYKISKGNTVAGRNIIVDAYNDVTWVKSIINTNLDNVDFTIDHIGYDKIVVYLLINNGQSLNNLIFYPMIRDARISDSTYVPYTKTNLELTKDTSSIEAIVNVYGSKNSFPDYGKDYDNLGTHWTHNADGSFTVSGGIAQNWIIIEAGRGVLKKGTYCLSSGLSDSDKSKAYCEIYNIDTGAAIIDTSFYNPVTFNISDGDKNVAFRLIGHSGADFTTPVTIYPMIRDARISDSTYVPYAMTNKELTEKKADKAVQAIELNSCSSLADIFTSLQNGWTDRNAYCSSPAQGYGFIGNGVSNSLQALIGNPGIGTSVVATFRLVNNYLIEVFANNYSSGSAYNMKRKYIWQNGNYMQSAWEEITKV